MIIRNSAVRGSVSICEGKFAFNAPAIEMPSAGIVKTVEVSPPKRAFSGPICAWLTLEHVDSFDFDKLEQDAAFA